MKYVKYGLVIFLCVFSFYISDTAIIMVENMSPIMKEVKKYSDNYVEPVNAIIEDNTIIPGTNGTKLNERESYLKMNEFGTFNETFLVYDYIKPDISLYDNLDKVIIKTNKTSEVALIVLDSKWDSYFKENKIKYTKVIKTSEDIDSSISYINGNGGADEFNKLNSFLKKNNLNSKICLVDHSNIASCKSNKYFIVKPTIEISHSNLASVKKNISGGDILLLNSTLSLSEVKVIISHIKYNNNSIVSLSDLIKE